MVTVPTQGDEFAKFIHNLTLCQEGAYMLAHLARAQSNSSRDKALADGWTAVGELMKRMLHQTTELAKGKLQ